ncbi:uncharacterized protein ARMOST_02489 [Armillaria ostoyae]|uniref:Uncharacterized protein n=1 Tax=Armillaria ostoyae TaxID=47428 RepID=A0A284QRU3_ARMOS|nr:uncharacterized protein ARMOST_02489 [Armillaria ostoyae]
MFRNVRFMWVTHVQIPPNDVDQKSKNNSDNCHLLQMEIWEMDTSKPGEMELVPPCVPGNWRTKVDVLP